MTGPIEPFDARSSLSIGEGPQGLASTSYDRDDCRVIELTGVADIATYDILDQILTDARTAPPGPVVLDLSHVTFLDAHCSGCLVNLALARYTVLVAPTAIVARVLDIIDPNQHLPRHRTLDDLTRDDLTTKDNG